MQRFIGVSLGALVTYLLLVILDATTGDASPKYGMAVVIGAIVSWLWPWVIGIFLARRVKARHDQKISDEVDKQLAEERKKG
jgi:ATP/ADP translocase